MFAQKDFALIPVLDKSGNRTYEQQEKPLLTVTKEIELKNEDGSTKTVTHTEYELNPKVYDLENATVENHYYPNKTIILPTGEKRVVENLETKKLSTGEEVFVNANDVKHNVLTKKVDELSENVKQLLESIASEKAEKELLKQQLQEEKEKQIVEAKTETENETK